MTELNFHDFNDLKFWSQCESHGKQNKTKKQPALKNQFSPTTSIWPLLTVKLESMDMKTFPHVPLVVSIYVER